MDLNKLVFSFLWSFVFGIAQWVLCFSIRNVVAAHTKGMSSSRGRKGGVRERELRCLQLCNLQMRTEWKYQCLCFQGCRHIRSCISKCICLCSSRKSPFFFFKLPSGVFVYLHWKKAGNGQSLDKTGRQTDEHAKMWPKERKARLKTRKDKRRKRQRELGWWRKWRETGPLTWPHLHTWASLSLPAVHCGRLREDTLAHIYTYLRMLAMRTYLACVNVCACVCEHKCVFGCDSLSMRAKESANATRNPTVCVCFSFQPFSLCFHIPEPVCTSVHVCLCVYIYLHVRWSVLVVISICFSCSATRARRILVCSVSPWITPSSQSLHCASRLWTISNVEHKWSN